MAELNKGQLATENTNSFPNNNAGLITPVLLRTFNGNMIDSLVDEVSYSIDSASFSSSIAALKGFSSSLDATFATDAQLTALSTSIAVTDSAQSASIAALQGFSSSLDATFATDAQLTALSTSVAVTDNGQDSKINSLTNATSSYITSAQTASMNVLSSSYAVTASFSLNAGASVDTGSLVTTSSFNSYTQSNDSKVTSLINKTGSFATTGSNIFTAGNTFKQGITIKELNNPLLETNIATNTDGRLAFEQGAVGSGNNGFSFDYDITVSGSIYISGSNKVFGTASFADNAGSVVSASFATNSTSASYAETASFATTASFALNAGASIDTSSFATTGSNTFVGNQTITGSIRNKGNIFVESTDYNIGVFHISSSAPSGNLVFLSGSLTSSIVISGSSNILLGTRPNTGTIPSGYYGYINGSRNLNFVIPALSTSSLLRPEMTGNIINRFVTLNFITSSFAGNPQFSGNTLLGGGGATNINHQSGSLNFSSNIVNGGNIFTSTQNVTADAGRVGITGNIFNGTQTFLHTSSSITLDRNVMNGLTSPSIRNEFSNSLSENVVFSRNLVNGSNNGVLVSGSSTNASGNRQIVDNFIGGVQTSVTSSHNGLNNNNTNLVASIIYGYGLQISASSATAQGGNAYFGRYNETGSNSSVSSDIIFAVGTGTSASARKTGLFINSASLTTINGGLFVSQSQLTVANSGASALAIAIRSGSFELTTPQGSGSFYSNLPITSSALRINGDALVNDLIISGVFSGNSSLQVLGDSAFTGSSSFVGTALFSTGSNKQAGTVVLDGGNPATASISNSLVTSNSIILLTKQTLTNHASVSVTSKSSGIFTIESSHNGDTDTVAWFIINNS